MGSGNSGTSGNNNSSGSGGSSASPGTGSKMSPLCQWAEVHGHPGLFTCMMLQNNAPVVIFVKPNNILVQEIKIAPSKSKITDIVALRHTPTTDPKTTLILLCEDGSLKVFMANKGLTDCWLNNNETGFSAAGEMSISAIRRSRKKKTLKLSGRAPRAATYPVDFIEHCSIMTDIEFGGTALLEVYNVQQLKSRLSAPQMYVASSSPGGITLEVNNKENNMVICGFRLSICNVDSHKNPSYIEVFGRSIAVNTTPRNRWFDVPMSREESLQADKKMVIVFGPSADPSHFTVIDVVHIYGKTKEDFGWPDDADYYNTSGVPTSGSGGHASVNASVASKSDDRSGELDGSSLCSYNNSSPSVLESLFCSALDTLDGCFSTMPNANRVYKQEAMDIVTKMIMLPLSPPLQACTRSLLQSLHDSRQSYHEQLDSAQLKGVTDMMANLLEVGEKEPALMDCQNFHNLVVAARGVAVSRPNNLVR